MEERLKQLQEAISQSQHENRDLRGQLVELREQVSELRDQVADLRIYETSGPPPTQRKLRARWSVVVLAIALIGVPSLAFTFAHTNAFWSTFIAAVNGIVLYIVGPGVWRLLMEGLFRAIPGVLFGQAARVAVDTYRRKKAQ